MLQHIPSRVHTSRARTLLLTFAATAALIACSDGRVTEAAGELPAPGLPGLLPTTATPLSDLSGPMPSVGDRILFDARTSLQEAADLGAALAIWGYSSTTRSQWGFTTDMDGNGTNALRVDWASAGGLCSTQSPEITRTLPTPYPKRAYMQWKQRLGRTETGGGVGAVGALMSFAPSAARPVATSG